MPKETSIELPLLRVIADAGGELPLHEAIRRVERFFPDLTEEDKQKRYQVSGHPVWSLRVRWARQSLVSKGYLYREPKGTWRITPEGQTYLEEKWTSWQPRYSGYEVDETLGERGARRPGRRTLGTARPQDGITSSESASPERRHERLKSMLTEIGTIMGFHAEQEFREAPYVYDVVWKEFVGSLPSRVFEVQDRGNLIQALAKLQHAKDVWRSAVFLVVTGERDRRRLEQLVAPLLAGTFHRLARSLTVLLPEQIEELHSALVRHRELVQKLLPQ